MSWLKNDQGDYFWRSTFDGSICAARPLIFGERGGEHRWLFVSSAGQRGIVSSKALHQDRRESVLLPSIDGCRWSDDYIHIRAESMRELADELAEMSKQLGPYLREYDPRDFDSLADALADKLNEASATMAAFVEVTGAASRYLREVSSHQLSVETVEKLVEEL